MEKEISDYMELEKDNKPRHLPGYNYCGPGTKVVTSLENNVPAINGLDEGCRVHDVEYMEFAGDKEGLENSDEKLINTSKSWRKQSDYTTQRKNFFSKVYDWLSSKGVEKVFQGKKLLEKIKVIDSVDFTRKLSKKPISEEREMGRYLKRKFLNK